MSLLICKTEVKEYIDNSIKCIPYIDLTNSADNYLIDNVEAKDYVEQKTKWEDSV